jgi:glycosyltransferase involved in cell wall biosynthesis
MKITMLVLNNYLGDARVHKEASTLAAAGHRVTVLALHRPGLEREVHAHGYRLVRLALRGDRFKGGRVMPLLKYLDYMRQVWQVTRQDPAEVYHCHDGNTLPAAFPVVRRDQAAWVYDAHELETGRNFGGSNLARFYHWLWPLPERLFIRRTDAVITASPSFADELVRLYRIPPPTVLINAPETIPLPQSDILRQRLGLPSQARILLYQGRVEPNRGIETSILALPLLDETIHLAVIGAGPSLVHLEALAQQTGVAGRVHFLGHLPLEQLPEYTAAADIGLSLIQNTCRSYYLTLPNKIMEYQMAGLPVIASDFPEYRRVVRDCDSGETLQDPSSPEELAAAVRNILSDPERHASLRRNARQGALIYCWENEQARLLDLYQRLADRRAARRPEQAES